MRSKVGNTHYSRSLREATIHAHIGRQMRRARDRVGLSARAMADRLGVPVGRLAAYEDGSEGLTARGLLEVATILEQSVSFFFDDLDVEPPTLDAVDSRSSTESPVARLAETRALIDAYYRIADVDTRRDVVRLVRGIADDL